MGGDESLYSAPIEIFTSVRGVCPQWGGFAYCAGWALKIDDGTRCRRGDSSCSVVCSVLREFDDGFGNSLWLQAGKAECCLTYRNRNGRYEVCYLHHGGCTK